MYAAWELPHLHTWAHLPCHRRWYWQRWWACAPAPQQHTADIRHHSRCPM